MSWSLKDSRGFTKENDCFFPQQRKLTGSSAQNSSGVHWCRHRVRFNEKVPKVPEKVWDLVQRQVRFNRFNRVPEKVAEKVPEKVLGESFVQGQVRFQQGHRVCSAWFRITLQKDL